MDKAGFILALIGVGGLSESYGNTRATIISIAMVLIGSGLIYIGIKGNEKNNNKCSDSNVLDRLYFLRS